MDQYRKIGINPKTNPNKVKPKLDLSGVVFSKTPEELEKSKPKLDLSGVVFSKTPEEINIKPSVGTSLYKSISLEPFKLLYNQGRKTFAYISYCKAIGIRAANVSIKKFYRLMEGEDIDPILNIHNISPKAKSKLTISSPQDNDIPERNVFNRIDVVDKMVNTAKRHRAIGKIEGIEADGSAVEFSC